MSQMICPFCRRAFPGDFKWCMEDGSELEQNIGQYESAAEDELNKVPCPDCGEQVDVRDVFCGSCGAKLTGRLPEYVPLTVEPEEEPEPAAAPAAATPAVGQIELEVDAQAVPPRNCPSCGAGIKLEDTFCGECGAKVESAAGPTFEPRIEGRHCKSCAAGLEPGDTYCGVCGAAVAPEDVEPAAPGVKCEVCGASVGEGEMFCGECGSKVKPAAAAAAAPVPSALTCPTCFVAVTPGDEFCGECGQSLKVAPKKTAAPQAQPAPPAVAKCPACGAQHAPGDTFCGECGQSLAGAAQTAATAPTAQPGVAAVKECPNCGMDIGPGEVFCGTCGFDFSQQVQRPPDLAGPEIEIEPEPEPEPIEIKDPFGGKGMKQIPTTCPGCGLQVPAGSKTCKMCGAKISKAGSPVQQAGAASCPNCGMEIEPGGTFCGTCGHDISGAAAPEDEPSEPESLTGRSISDIMKDVPVCPSCGVEGEPGQDTCFACGASLTTSGVLEPGAPDSFSSPIEEHTPAPVTEISDSYPEEEPATAVETATAPEPAPAAPQPASQPAGDKICSCCGTTCPADSEFCSNCGVDFD